MASEKNCLPGFGYPVNHQPTVKDAGYIGPLYPNALSLAALGEEVCGLNFTTLREFSMMRFMNAVTDKAEWYIKVHDEAIVAKWKEEVFKSDFTEKMFDWCIAELRHKAQSVPEPPGVPPPVIVYDANVVKSDFAVTPEVKEELRSAMKAFEASIPNRHLDWHPFSDEKVLDLVHPSLFPLVYGKTRVLERGRTDLQDCIDRCGEGKVTSVPDHDDIDIYQQQSVYSSTGGQYSAQFQWLPAEVDISGDEAKITSYINNLHPRERDIYRLVSKVITAAIPLWELTLAPLQDGEVELPPTRIEHKKVTYDPDPEKWDASRVIQREPDEDEDDYYQRREDWFASVRQLVIPEPGDFHPRPSTQSLNLRELKYRKSGLQVVVKFANIVLTPDKPEYGGGVWHVEGHMNEHIVATALYYYDSENIEASSLAFRQQVVTQDANEIVYRQEHHDWLETIYGCEQHGPGVQEVGSIETREGRLLTFPNIIQHRVSPLKLAEPTKPGHRKILALFLVDPNIKVISTAHVPCQRKDWWKEAVIQQCRMSNGNLFARLPVELQMHIFDEVTDFPVDMDEAKDLRIALMEERKEYTLFQDNLFSGCEFSLCEH